MEPDLFCLQEFYTPMRQNGMLNSEQLEVVFTNLHELIQVNEQFLHKLQNEVATAANNNEEVGISLTALQ